MATFFHELINYSDERLSKKLTHVTLYIYRDPAITTITTEQGLRRYTALDYNTNVEFKNTTKIDFRIGLNLSGLTLSQFGLLHEFVIFKL